MILYYNNKRISMAAIRFVCYTNNKASHDEVKRKLFFAGGAITREKVRDLGSGYTSELEMICEGPTLYRELKDSELCVKVSLLDI